MLRCICHFPDGRLNWNCSKSLSRWPNYDLMGVQLVWITNWNWGIEQILVHCFWIIHPLPQSLIYPPTYWLNHSHTLFTHSHTYSKCILFQLHVQVTSEEDVKAALDTFQLKFGGLTAAINCAGIGVAKRTLSKKGPHPLDLFQVLRPIDQHFTDLKVAQIKMSDM